MYRNLKFLLESYGEKEIHPEVQKYIDNGSKGDLNLDQVKSLTFLPDNLEVEGNLILRHTKIKALPNNLKVGGELDLLGTPIASLPNNLKINGELNLLGTPIRSLPSGLEVNGDLNLGWSSVESLPDDLKVGRNLILRGSNIVSISQLPLTMVVKGKITSHNHFSEEEIRKYKSAVRDMKVNKRIDKSLLKDFSEDALKALEDF